jgi:hypothetical protein
LPPACVTAGRRSSDLFVAHRVRFSTSQQPAEI